LVQCCELKNSVCSFIKFHSRIMVLYVTKVGAGTV
jgi:hypothetical protein